jgi:hypothetical protein
VGVLAAGMLGLALTKAGSLRWTCFCIAAPSAITALHTISVIHLHA